MGVTVSFSPIQPHWHDVFVISSTVHSSNRSTAHFCRITDLKSQSFLGSAPHRNRASAVRCSPRSMAKYRAAAISSG